MYKNDVYSNKVDSYYQHNRAEMLKFIPKNAKRILEIGCGNGAFGKLVKDNTDCEYWGVEPDVRFKNEANTNLDYFINDEFKNTLNIPCNYFDAIVFNDVLEHMLYPEDILIICKQFLKHNGLIISSIPNIRFYTAIQEIIFNKDFPYQDSGTFDKTHFRFFTKKSIVRMFEENNFEIVVIEPINIQIIQSRKMRVLRFILKKWLDDINVLQYVIVAHQRDLMNL